MNPRDVMNLAPVIPVLAFESVEQALEQSQALVTGGLPVLEITLRTACALDAIREVSNAIPDAVVGVGTVCNPRQLNESLEAGATFAVSPGATDALWQEAVTTNTAMLAGTATISDVMRGMHYGFDAFKFFPAEINGGAAALKAFGGPLPDVAFCPTGGVKPGNLNEYLSLPNVLCAGGTWLTPKGATASEIETLARQAIELAKSGH